MNNNNFLFPRVPYPRVDDIDLTIYIEFEGNKTYIPQVSPDNQAHNKAEAILKGRIYTEKIFFLHFLKQKRLPKLKIKPDDDGGFVYEFIVDGSMYFGWGETYKLSFATGVNHILRHHNIKGILKHV